MGRPHQRSGLCAYCRETSDALEEEHVFPESWYPTSTPAGVELITTRGRTERDARARAGNREKLKASIRPVPVGARGAFPGLGAVAPSWSLQSSGLFAPSSDAVMVKAPDVSSLTEKLVRGLHFRVHGAPVPADVTVKTYVVTQDAWPERLATVRTMAPQGLPPGFLFWRGVAKDDPMFAVWYFLIWGQVFLQASTIPPRVHGLA